MTNIRLPYKLIHVTGPDAERFLQGQVSCDLSALNLNELCYGTANTPKGRMYLIFLAAKVEDGFILRANEQTVDQALATLGKYKVFFKCDVALMQDYSVLGRYSANFDADAKAMQLVSNQEEWLFQYTKNEARCEIWSRNTGEIDNEKIAQWLAEDCMLGVPEIYPETLEHFILQQLNLQDLGAVSFSKGCYTGQEIIARMKYLGKLKKKMYLVNFDLDVTAKPKDALLSAEGKKIGELVRAHKTTDRCVGLAVLDIAYTETASSAFFDHSPTRRIQLSKLHYKTD